MAKVHLDRIRQKYNFKGESLDKLSQKIIVNNTENIAKKTARTSKVIWDKSLRKIQGKKGKQFIIPNIQEIVPKRGVFAIKATQNGTKIAQTLNESLTRNIRTSVFDFESKTGKKFIIPKGPKAGTINPEAVNFLEKRMRTTFESYTKRDKKFKMPPNVRGIATTELRSTINDTKLQFAQTLQKKNPKRIKMKKRWIHNRRLSKNPRKPHMALDRPSAEVLLKTKFRVRNEQTGVIDLMDRPHDPSASLGNIINCNCDLKLIAQVA